MFANPERGEYLVIVGGEERLYRLTADACHAFKKATGKSVIQAAKSLADDMDEEILFRLLFAGLSGADSSLKYEAFSKDVTITDIMRFAGVAQIALGVAIGEPEGDEGNATAGEIPATST